MDEQRDNQNEPKTHKDLDVWKRAIHPVTAVYQATDSLPKHEVFGLQSQIRRAAVSVPTNIAEGAGRQSKKESVQFLHIAIGSLGELETLLIIANNLHLFDSAQLLSEVEALRKMTFGLIKSVKKTSSER